MINDEMNLLDTFILKDCIVDVRIQNHVWNACRFSSSLTHSISSNEIGQLLFDKLAASQISPSCRSELNLFFN
jgi:hypothetical protein